MKIHLTEHMTISNFGAPYIIAEIGANHNGDMDLAKKLIDSAVNCGCDAVKFQSWTPESLIAKEEYDRNQTYDDGDGGKKHFGSLKEMVQQYYLREEQHKDLSTYCKEKGIDFCSSPFSNKEIDLLVELDVPFLKIASMDINNIPLLRYAAASKKPIILSTGMATLEEIESAVNEMRHIGNNQIALLHCVSIYPPKDKDVHLLNIKMLQETFGLPVGFSDHTKGYTIPLASVTLGACIIEKHFTLDKDFPGWDHAISADPYEMGIICRGAKQVHAALGSLNRKVSKEEEVKKLKFRRSIVASKPIYKGHIIQQADLLYKRPGTGIPPNRFEDLVGKEVLRDIDKDELFNWTDFNL